MMRDVDPVAAHEAAPPFVMYPLTMLLIAPAKLHPAQLESVQALGQALRRPPVHQFPEPGQAPTASSVLLRGALGSTKAVQEGATRSRVGPTTTREASKPKADGR